MTEVIVGAVAQSFRSPVLFVPGLYIYCSTWLWGRGEGMDVGVGADELETFLGSLGDLNRDTGLQA